MHGLVSQNCDSLVGFQCVLRHVRKKESTPFEFTFLGANAVNHDHD